MLCAALSWGTGRALAAQEAPPAPRGPDQGPSVVLLTMGPGDAIWEKFGHNAIWIRDPVAGVDVAYNWGMFDFAAEGFIPRLVKGEMLYWMAGYDGEATLRAYRAMGRDVFAQELRLTPAQKLALVEYLRETDTPANRFYAYDYYLDNCSTRVRDALDRVLGGRLRAELGSLPTGITWREHAERILRTAVWAYVGMQLALGSPSDREMTAWEEAFLPMKLRDRLRTVTVPGPSGEALPLVMNEVQLVDGGRPTPPDAPPRWLPWFLLAGVVAALAVALPGGAGASQDVSTRLAAAVAALWSGLAGAAGLLVLLAWLFTDHTFWYRNENLLQASPVSLLLVPVLAWAALGRGTPRWGRPVAFVVLAISVLGAVLQVLPAFDQSNGEIIAFALPLHAAVAWRLSRAGTDPTSART